MIRLHWNFSTSVRAFCWKNVGPMALFMDPQNLSKHRFQYKFGSYSTIHTFKNYFAIIFSVISFQFSANKRYLNTSLLFIFFSHFVFVNAHVNPTMPHCTAHLCPCLCPRRQPTTTKQLRYGGRKWIKKKKKCNCFCYNASYVWMSSLACLNFCY